MSNSATAAHAQPLTHAETTVPLTLPAEKVTMGRKMMPSFASGTFVQTAASTAITAPDWWHTHTHRENVSGEKYFGFRDI